VSAKASVLNRIADVSAADWDALAAPGEGRARNPFVTHRFLLALEDSGSVGRGTGWNPSHIAVHDNGALVGAMPLYLKSHSQGEYVFDYGWAQAWENAGGRYYPKLQSAVPFTPVTGPRLLTHDPEVRRHLLATLAQMTDSNRLSSAHITFCTEDEAETGSDLGFLHRTGQQFHWENPGYSSFNDFLDALSSRKRKTIRKERETAQAFGGEILQLTGDQIQPEHWDAMWAFYQDTGSRKWGQPYLTRRFFDRMHDTMRDDVLLILARKDGAYVAGALNLIGTDTLFGRYWGQTRYFDCMHFELCYYQAIDAAVRLGLRVEAGAQGEHKLARGYLPKITHSLHYIPNESFRRAVAEFLTAEQAAVAEEADILTSYGPFKRGGDDRE
jgi:uncharacterized protein